MSAELNVIALAVGAALLLLLARGWGALKAARPGFDLFVSKSPLLERLLFIAAAAAMGAAVRLVGGGIPDGLAAAIPAMLEGALLNALGGTVVTGSYAMGRNKP